MVSSRRRFLLVAVLLVLCCMVVESERRSESRADHQLSKLNNHNTRRLLGSMECGGKCKARCSAHSRPNVCLRACTTCCYRCSCVPPGTSGNRELCGRCYTDMTTHGNKPKCP